MRYDGFPLMIVWEIEGGETSANMKRLGVAALVVASSTFGQDHLSQQEINAAIAAPPNSGFVLIEDGGFSTPSLCEAQMPSVSLFTPSGWLNARSQSAKKQLLDYVPKQEDTRRVLTIISRGCVGKTLNDTHQSVTRVVLLSPDHKGKLEAIETRPFSDSWQNSYGATATTMNVVSTFSMEKLERVQSKDGEFAVATMNPSGITKIYTVKRKHLKKLGL
jgi:hypothetical protein